VTMANTAIAAEPQPSQDTNLASPTYIAHFPEERNSSAITTYRLTDMVMYRSKPQQKEQLGHSLNPN